MTDSPMSLLIEIDRLVAHLEEDYPTQLIFEALTEYMEMADEFGLLR
ncbi:hypothetical protein STIP28_24 [Synechococcus T7-like virus S-TIP28]|uniref:Uncharacterized protein n=1 Tax=Synechococcus T7-like virus S-TIP28 TaxID=1332140 RepID=A0AAE8XHE8_9CAUD|nr:hypothetical protein STIP28_24 [Synechococcus T7-like virus S-TIP28]